MNNEAQQNPLILVVEDIEETRIERLLIADGYRVDPARNEEDAVIKAKRTPPNLILVSFGWACGGCHRGSLAYTRPGVVERRASLW
jgi:PleD family two-component response regulator